MIDSTLIEAVLAGVKAPTLRASLRFDAPDECWPWQGFIGPQGYGYAYEPVTLRRVPAHRLVWMLFVGPLTTKQVLDHMCHDPDTCHLANECPHRACVNPRHLRVTTLAHNTLRGDGPTARNAQKTRCKNGHPFDAQNTIQRSGGGRTCRACMIERARGYTLKRGGKPRLARRTVSDEELRKVDSGHLTDG